MITVAICTADRYKSFSDLLSKLSPQIASNCDYRLLVVDSSLDINKGISFANSLYQPNQLIYLQGTKLGLSTARNIAISACTTPYIVYIDDDAIPCANWLSNILKVFISEGEQCAVVGGKIEPLWLFPRPQWLPDQLLPYLSILDLGSNQHELDITEKLYGTNIAFRLSALKTVGGFRANLGRTKKLLLSNEETELQQRLIKQDMKIIYSPDITVRHKICADRLTRQWFYKRIFWQAISDKIVENYEHGVFQEMLDKYKNTIGCPAHLIQKKLNTTEDPDVFFQHCASIYENTCIMVENDK